MCLQTAKTECVWQRSYMTSGDRIIAELAISTGFMLCHTPNMALPNPIVQSPYSTFYHISFQVYFRSSISIERTSRDVFSLFLTSFDQDQTKKFLQGWTKMTLFHITGTTQYVYYRAKYFFPSNYHMLKMYSFRMMPPSIHRLLPKEVDNSKMRLFFRTMLSEVQSLLPVLLPSFSSLPSSTTSGKSKSHQQLQEGALKTYN